ncbi:hypothetical protein AB0F11_30295 [Streptomyces sp. NPDC032472]
MSTNIPARLTDNGTTVNLPPGRRHSPAARGKQRPTETSNCG